MFSTVAVNMTSYTVSDKALAVYLGISFVLGTIFGYKLKTWRLKYLQAKRDYFRKKALQTQTKIDAAATW